MFPGERVHGVENGREEAGPTRRRGCARRRFHRAQRGKNVRRRPQRRWRRIRRCVDRPSCHSARRCQPILHGRSMIHKLVRDDVVGLRCAAVGRLVRRSLHADAVGPRSQAIGQGRPVSARGCARHCVVGVGRTLDRVGHPFRGIGQPLDDRGRRDGPGRGVIVPMAADDVGQPGQIDADLAWTTCVCVFGRGGDIRGVAVIAGPVLAVGLRDLSAGGRGCVRHPVAREDRSPHAEGDSQPSDPTDIARSAHSFPPRQVFGRGRRYAADQRE